MTNETNTEDRNLVVAWFTAGLLILACVLFASWGSSATEEAKQIAGRNGFVADSAIKPAAPTVTAEAGEGTEQANFTPNARNVSELAGSAEDLSDSSAASQDVISSETDNSVSFATPDDSAATDSNATLSSSGDSDTPRSTAEPADVEPLNSDADGNAANHSHGNTASESELASQTGNDIATFDPLSEDLAINEDLVVNEDLGIDEIITPPTEDPVSAAEVANSNTFDELAEQLPNETSSLDNGAIAESPTTDLPNDADNIPAASDGSPPVVTIAESTTASDSQPSIDTPTPIATDTTEFVPSNVEKPLAETIPTDNSATTTLAPATKIEVATASQSNRPFLGVGIRETGGSVVTTLYDNSTATNLGLKLGDRLTKINGESVYDLPSIKKALAKLKVGDETKITLVRDGTQMEFGPAALTSRKK